MQYTTVLLLLIPTLIQKISAGCDVEINKLPRRNQPLYLIKGRDVHFPSSHNGHMILDSTKEIELYCAQYQFPVGKSGSLVLTCNSGVLFYNGPNSYDITQITCSNPINSITRKKRLVVNDMYEVGFEIGSPPRFIKQLDIKFDFNSKATQYVKYTLRPGSSATTHIGPDFNFAADSNTFGMTTPQVDQLYRQPNQVNMTTIVLGIPTYINARNFWARGHLAANADFVYLNEQKATYTFMNVAPQWQSFNGGNWKTMEKNVRDLLKSKKLSGLDIYTGVAGFLTPLNSAGVPTRLYLNHTINIIPVPKIFYKVVIEPKTSQGVVLVGANDPYLNITLDRSYFICTDVTSRIGWLTWNRAVPRLGYSYACEVPEFTRLYPYLLPNLHVTSLLV